MVSKSPQMSGSSSHCRKVWEESDLHFHKMVDSEFANSLKLICIFQQNIEQQIREHEIDSNIIKKIKIAIQQDKREKIQSKKSITWIDMDAS